MLDQSTPATGTEGPALNPQGIPTVEQLLESFPGITANLLYGFISAARENGGTVLVVEDESGGYALAIEGERFSGKVGRDLNGGVVMDIANAPGLDALFASTGRERTFEFLGGLQDAAQIGGGVLPDRLRELLNDAFLADFLAELRQRPDQTGGGGWRAQAARQVAARMGGQVVPLNDGSFAVAIGLPEIRPLDVSTFSLQELAQMAADKGADAGYFERLGLPPNMNPYVNRRRQPLRQSQTYTPGSILADDITRAGQDQSPVLDNDAYLHLFQLADPLTVDQRTLADRLGGPMQDTQAALVATRAMGDLFGVLEDGVSNQATEEVAERLGVVVSAQLALVGDDESLAHNLMHLFEYTRPGMITDEARARWTCNQEPLDYQETQQKPQQEMTL